MAGRVYFTSVRAALVFAFNHEDLSIPGPVMNREMAQNPPGTAQGGGSGPGKGAVRATPKNAQIGGLEDRTILAGWIIQRVTLLPPTQQLVLAGQCIKPRRPCSCGRACCRGWLVKREWAETIKGLTEYLKTTADLAREPGKRGYSTDPRLRVVLVEDFMKPESKRHTLVDLAEIAETTSLTVARHRTLIFEHLQKISDEAWEEISRDLDQIGLVGEAGDFAGD